jgi:hypothetical protein
MALSKMTRSGVSCGKQVPQLGEHANQWIPPLKVYNDKNIRLADKAGQLGLIIGQYLRIDPMPDPNELA